MKSCKINDCNEPRVRGALLCAAHLGDKRRCEGQVPIFDDHDQLVDHRQCKNSAMKGTMFCRHHTGTKNKIISARTEALTQMQLFVKPYEGDLDPISAFELEYRRTYGRIMWLESRIANLASEEELIFGKTKVEEIRATEWSGTNTTYETRIHGYEESLRWERKHWLELTKLWVKAGLEERKLSMMQDYIRYTVEMVSRTVKALGLDPDAPEVRDKLQAVFARDADLEELI